MFLHVTPITNDGGMDWKHRIELEPGESLIGGAPADLPVFTARTTNGAVAIDWTGGPGLFSVYGTWGGATVQLAYSPDGGTTYIDTDGGLFSADATLIVAYPAGKVRATVAGATGPTSLSAKLQSTR